MKDPRNLQSKSFLQTSIKTLVSFLIEMDFPLDVSCKTLTSPGTQHFIDICHFLFREFDPTFEFSDWRVEFPLFLQILGYPFKIRAQSLQNVASPHAWTALLAALLWVVELIQYREAIANEEPEKGDEFSQKMFIEYIESSYSRFMQGEDMDDLEADLMNMCDEKAAKLEEEIQGLVAETASLTGQINGFESAKVSFLELLQNREKLTEELQKTEVAIKKNQTVLSSLEKESAVKSAQLQGAERSTREASDIRDELKGQIEAQPLNADDVDRIRKECQILDHGYDELLTKEELMKTHKWELERECGRLTEELEMYSLQFNERAETLVSAESVGFADLTISGIDKKSLEFHEDLRSNTKPALVKLAAQLKEENRQSHSDKRQLLEALRKTAETRQEKVREVASIQERLQKIETTTIEEQQKSNELIHQIVAQVEDIELRLLRNSDASNEMISKDAMCSHLEEELEHIVNSSMEKEEDLINEIMVQVETLVEHKLYISSTLEKLNTVVSQIKDSISRNGVLPLTG